MRNTAQAAIRGAAAQGRTRTHSQAAAPQRRKWGTRVIHQESNSITDPARERRELVAKGVHTMATPRDVRTSCSSVKAN